MSAQRALVGEVTDFSGAFVPYGYLRCDGSIYQRSLYPELFQLLGNRYGGDGITSFGVPNLPSTSMICYDGDYPQYTSQSLPFSVGYGRSTTVTYAELVSLISDEKLTPGEFYFISDYRTVHTIPNTTDTNTGLLEPLLVFAISPTALGPNAYSALFPNDEIGYSVSNAVFTGSTKGHITYRWDKTPKSRFGSYNNRFPFDFRNVKFRRWAVNVTDTWSAATTYSANSLVVSGSDIYYSLQSGNLNNVLTDASWWRKVPFFNGAFVSLTPSLFDVGGLYFPVSSSFQDFLAFTSGNSVILEGYSHLSDIVFFSLCFRIRIAPFCVSCTFIGVCFDIDFSCNLSLFSAVSNCRITSNTILAFECSGFYFSETLSGRVVTFGALSGSTIIGMNSEGGVDRYFYVNSSGVLTVGNL